jgi:hypothetical protein
MNHAVDLRETAAIATRLPLQLGSFYPRGIPAFQIVDETKKMVVGDRRPVYYFVSILVNRNDAITVMGNVHQTS